MRTQLWPHIRLFLILFHIAAIAIRALPNTNHYRRSADWEHPSVKAELKQWSSNLSRVGITASPRKLRRMGIQFANRYGSIYLSVVKPFRPYYRYCGTDQDWILFSAPDLHPSRLRVERLSKGEWLPLYIPFTEHDWQGHLIESGRFRAAISRFGIQRYSTPRKRFRTYLGQQAASDFPDSSQLRVRWERRKTPSPAQVRNGIIPEWNTEKEHFIQLTELR